MISIAVMTHPIRLHFAEQVMQRIPKQFNPVLFVDTETKGIWNNAMNAWKAYDSDCHYHMVLQDDVLFCADFFEALPKILEVAYEINPNHSISFCDNFPQETKLAYKAGYSWFSTNRVRHAQALVQPIHQIDHFIEYSEQHVRPEFYHDDGRLEIYLMKHRKWILNTVPSLIEHDNQGSVTRILSGKTPKLEGANKYTSYSFIGEDGRALDLEWGLKVAGFAEKLSPIHRWAIGEIPVWKSSQRLNNGVFQFETSFDLYANVMKKALTDRGLYAE